MFSSPTTPSDKERINEAIIRAIKRLAIEKGIEISLAEAKAIYNHQISFTEEKIKAGGFETVTLPNFIKFEVNLEKVKAYMEKGKKLKIEKLEKQINAGLSKDI